MIKAIIFDMDGVLIDSETPYKAIEREMYTELGLDISEEEATLSMGRVVTEWWTELKERHGFEASVETLSALENKRYMDYLFDDTREKIKMEGIGTLLLSFKEKGYRLALASSSDIPAIERVIEMMDFEGIFEVKCSGTQVENGKPAPDIFLQAAELLCVKPEECVVVEDSYSGIAAAKAAGMLCVAYLSAPEGLVDYKMADYRVKDYADFFDIVSVV